MEKPRGKVLEQQGQPIRFSQRTLGASDLVTRELFAEQGPAKTSVETLELGVEQDLAKEGVDLRPDEKTTLRKKVKDFFFGEDAHSHDRIDPELLKGVDISKYVETFNNLCRTYGLDKQKGKFGILAALMIQGKVISDLAGTSVSNIAMILWRENEHLPQAKSFIGRWIASKWVPEATLPNFRSMKPGMPEAMDVGREFLGQAEKFKWPLAVVAAWAPSAVAEVAADFRMVDAMKSVRQAVNERAANSLVMRDFEFIHDKSSSEINNILEKGKQATVDLIHTTFSDVMPRVAAIGLASAGQIPFNPIGGVLQLLRLPFLYKTSLSYAKTVLADRAADLQRKDFIDTRIAATLGSLEVVKTSDSMEMGATDLATYMKERDTAKSTQSKAALKEDIKRDWLGVGFSLGIPALTAGLERLVYGEKGKPGEKAVLTAMSEAIVRNNTNDLMKLYIDKIQPALQDVKRMEDLLGPYDQLDKPDGQREQRRVGVSTIPNFDISVRNFQYRDILRNVSLDVPQGSFVTIKGPSGSGKTSLLRSMVGLYGAAEGSVSYGGKAMQDIQKYGNDSIYTALAYANQNPQYFENMTLKENLLLWTKRDVADEQIRQVLHDLRLDPIIDRLDSTVKHFSGGELRRIGIARALLKDPKVLFLDEPTANLDDESAKQVVDIITHMRKKRPDMTIVAVTHDPNFEAISERIVDLREINAFRPESLGSRQVYYATGKPAQEGRTTKG